MSFSLRQTLLVRHHVSRLQIMCNFLYSKRTKVHVCIVGSGPAGFYTADALIKHNIHVDIFEKLPVPFGLVRYGIAPDHYALKDSLIEKFSRVAEHSNCNFYGNVNVGQDVSITELLKVYSAVILATGANADNTLGIPGEDLKNIFSSRKFVGWYNGLPADADEEVDLDTDTAVVIGHGNVGLDVARMLLHPVDNIKSTDVSEHAFEIFKKSKIQRVVHIGRRGPLQAAFSTKEARGVLNLPGSHAIMNSKDFEDISDILSSASRPQRRIIEMFTEAATKSNGSPVTTGRQWELKFFRSPKQFLPDISNKVEKLIVGINKYKDSPLANSVVNTGEEEVINCGLVVKSIRYKSTNIDPVIPFDVDKHIVSNTMGKSTLKGLYCSGWAKTGPKGVIASTLTSSKETAEMLLRDLEGGNLPITSDKATEKIMSLLKDRRIAIVHWKNWIAIDKVETERGIILGKFRSKICSTKEMLQTAGVA